MTRLIVIGIDGMDPGVFEQNKEKLPYLHTIMESGSFKRCASVFPPDSIPAWVTIFTGDYPEQHGWLDNIDYEDIRKGAAVSKLCDLQGRTFWDRISQSGKRVCIINPLLAYPVWPVNGIMASGPIFISGEKQIYPKDLAEKYELPELGGMTDFPSENELDLFLQNALQSTRALAQFGLNLLDSEPWDLFFISFFTLDRIQHFLWRFCDSSDPLYPGPSGLDDAILKAYITFDEIVGEFLKRTGTYTGLIVLSDHGHGQRPTLLLNLNESLRQAGLLKTTQAKFEVIPLKKNVEIAKNISIRLVVKFLGERWLYRIGRLLPNKTRKALKKSSYLIDQANSAAWVSELGGGASVGGITINPNISRSSQEYKQISSQIFQNLENFNRNSEERVVQWAKAREDISFYPEVIFELGPHYSVGRSLFCPLIENNPRHRIISGGHKKEGVFFAHNFGERSANIHSVSDIASNIIDFLVSQQS